MCRACTPDMTSLPISCADGSAKLPTPAMSAHSRRTLSDLSPASRALLFSQAGPHAARAFTVLSTSDDVAIPDSHFRIMLLRRACPSRLARAAAPASVLDAYADHRAACSTSGVARLPSTAPRTRHRPRLPASAAACRYGTARNLPWTPRSSAR